MPSVVEEIIEEAKKHVDGSFIITISPNGVGTYNDVLADRAIDTAIKVIFKRENDEFGSEEEDKLYLCLHGKFWPDVELPEIDDQHRPSSKIEAIRAVVDTHLAELLIESIGRDIYDNEVAWRHQLAHDVTQLSSRQRHSIRAVA